MELAGEELDAVGCFLEFLYTGDYFPKKLPGQRILEADPSIPAVDETGEQLLKHARVYSLAEKFGVEKLRSLASSKIHCVNSTAKGEIAYARYIYQFTSKEDTTVRAPVANFWATRSHTLRAEAEEEFCSLCLEFPQFGYDVLSKFPHLIVIPTGRATNLTIPSSCVGRETQTRTQRQATPSLGKRSQTSSSQQCMITPPLSTVIYHFFGLENNGNRDGIKCEYPSSIWEKVNAIGSPIFVLSRWLGNLFRFST